MFFFYRAAASPAAVSAAPPSPRPEVKSQLHWLGAGAAMGWLQLVGSFKLYVKETIFRKRDL